jgi:hypothetical protein
MVDATDARLQGGEMLLIGAANTPKKANSELALAFHAWAANVTNHPVATRACPLRNRPALAAPVHRLLSADF